MSLWLLPAFMAGAKTGITLGGDHTDGGGKKTHTKVFSAFALLNMPV